MRQLDDFETACAVVAFALLAIGIVVLLVMFDTAGARQAPSSSRLPAADAVAVGAENRKAVADGTIHPTGGGSSRRPLAEVVFEKEPMVVKSGTPVDAAAGVVFFCSEGLCTALETEVDKIEEALAYAAKKCAGREI